MPTVGNLNIKIAVDHRSVQRGMAMSGRSIKTFETSAMASMHGVAKSFNSASRESQSFATRVQSDAQKSSHALDGLKAKALQFVGVMTAFKAIKGGAGFQQSLTEATAFFSELSAAQLERARRAIRLDDGSFGVPRRSPASARSTSRSAPARAT